jgi:hypothetical protein
LPEIERLITHIDEYESLWSDGWEKVANAIESFEHGRSQVTEISGSGISVITLAPEIFSGSGFNPTRHAAPYTAISHYAKGTFFVIAIPTDGGWFYRLDYPYYSWAETVVRPTVPRRNLKKALQFLSQKETSTSGSWQKDSHEMTSALKFLDEQRTLAPSKLAPDVVANALSEQVGAAV